jgi:lysophospholipase L1-like esterase
VRSSADLVNEHGRLPPKMPDLVDRHAIVASQRHTEDSPQTFRQRLASEGQTPANMSRKQLATNLLLAVISVVVALLIAEFLLFRAIHPVRYRRPPKQLTGDVWRQQLHRPSAIPGLAYELAPNEEKVSHGAVIRTNSWGMRDDEPRPPGDTSVRRIVAIGDSVTFGFGVAGEDTYPNVLERRLNDGSPGERYEVLNLGVGGYSTRDEAIVLRHKGLRWNPELVVIGYVLNDPETEPLQPLHEYFQRPEWWQYSSLLRFIAQTVHNREVATYGGGSYERYLHAPELPKWQGVEAAFADIAAMARAGGFPVVLLIFPSTTASPWSSYPYRDLHRQVAAAATAAGFHVIDLLGEFSQHAPEDLMVDPEDGHPSKLGHAIAADELHRWIQANGIQTRFQTLAPNAIR